MQELKRIAEKMDKVKVIHYEGRWILITEIKDGSCLLRLHFEDTSLIEVVEKSLKYVESLV